MNEQTVFEVLIEGRKLQIVLPVFRLTATTLLEYAYCPRFVFFENHMEIPEYQEKRFKVQKGRQVHEERSQMNKGYLRKKLSCIQRVFHARLYDRSGSYSGYPDEVLFLEENQAAPLDYKWSTWKGSVHKTHQLQLAFYALLIARHYKKEVTSAYLVYVRSKHRLVEVPITEGLLQELSDAIFQIYHIQEMGLFPEAAKSSKQCRDCCYRNICPRV